MALVAAHRSQGVFEPGIPDPVDFRDFGLAGMGQAHDNGSSVAIGLAPRDETELFEAVEGSRERARLDIEFVRERGEAAAL